MIEVVVSVVSACIALGSFLLASYAFRAAKRDAEKAKEANEKARLEAREEFEKDKQDLIKVSSRLVEEAEARAEKRVEEAEVRAEKRVEEAEVRAEKRVEEAETRAGKQARLMLLAGIFLNPNLKKRSREIAYEEYVDLGGNSKLAELWQEEIDGKDS